MKQLLKFIQPFRNYMESHKAPLVIIDMEGKIGYFNPEFSSLSGILKKDAISNSSIHEAFHGADLDEWKILMGKENSFQRDVELIDAKGKKTNYKATIVLMGIPENPLGYMISIDSRAHVSPEVRYLKENNNILNAINNRREDATMISDIVSGEQIFVSKGFEKLSGWSVEEFMNGGWGFGVSLIHPDETKFVMETFRSNIELRHNHPYLYDHLPWNIRYRFKKKNGEFILINCEVTVLEREKKGDIRFILVSNKPMKEDEMLRATDSLAQPVKVINGEPYISLNYLEELLRPRKKPARTSSVKIETTERETEILKLVADGLSSEQIAKKLFLSPHTVNMHRRNLMKKLDAKNIVDLIRKAEKGGFLK